MKLSKTKPVKKVEDATVKITADLVLNAVSSHVALLDTKGIITYVNQAWINFARQNAGTTRKLPARTGIGSNYLQVLLDSKGNDAVEAMPAYRGIKKVLSGKLKRFTLDYPCHSPKERRWFSMTVLLLPGKKGVVVTHHDISASKLLLEEQKEKEVLFKKSLHDGSKRKRAEGARQKAELELEVVEKKYQHLAENIEAPIASVKSDGTVLFANERFAQLFDITATQMTGKLLSESIEINEAQERINIIRHVILSGRPYTDEKLVNNKTGTRWYRRTFRPFVSPGNDAQVLITGVEITAEKSEAERQQKYAMELEQKVEERTTELQQSLSKAQELAELKSKFVATTSHEFRTPLSVIALMAGFIRRNNEKVDKHIILEKLDNIEKQVHHMSSLLDDILLFGQSEAGQFKVKLKPVPLIPFIKSVVQEVEESRKTHVVNTRFVETIEQITTDEKLMRTIIVNLLTNAIKFSPDQKSVELSVISNRHGYQISVHDSGIGIPENDQKSLFQPFYRSGNANDIQGTGLGLSIVKNAVSLLGGTITFLSKQGKGTTFTVALPFLQP